MKQTRLKLAQQISRILPPILSQRLCAFIYPRELARHDDYEFVVSAQTGSLFKCKTSELHGYRFSVNGYNDWRNWQFHWLFAGMVITLLKLAQTLVRRQ